MVGPFGHLMADWRQIIVFISIASMLLGAVAGINQRNIKRLMAYSSIGHIGYAPGRPRGRNARRGARPADLHVDLCGA